MKPIPDCVRVERRQLNGTGKDTTIAALPYLDIQLIEGQELLGASCVEHLEL